MESQPQNPEFRINPENSQPVLYKHAQLHRLFKILNIFKLAIANIKYICTPTPLNDYHCAD